MAGFYFNLKGKKNFKIKKIDIEIKLIWLSKLLN